MNGYSIVKFGARVEQWVSKIKQSKVIGKSWRRFQICGSHDMVHVTKLLNNKLS